LPIVNEFSRLFALEGVPAGGQVVTLKATPDECRALAKRLDLVRLDQLAGEARIERAGDELVRVTGRLHAELAQRCVVTLEPVPATVDADFERMFSRDAPEETAEEIEIDLEFEPPEPMPAGGLDLGEILAEELSLALDPYPRSPEADKRLAELNEATDEAAKGPFGALAKLRRN
jgi:uncharacterized metal-binding protein YceD (DUF177 family)